MTRRSFPTALIALTASLLLVSSAALAQTPKRGGTLRVSYGNEIAHLDFHTAPGYEMMWVAMNVGCGLVSRYKGTARSRSSEGYFFIAITMNLAQVTRTLNRDLH